MPHQRLAGVMTALAAVAAVLPATVGTMAALASATTAARWKPALASAASRQPAAALVPTSRRLFGSLSLRPAASSTARRLRRLPLALPAHQRMAGRMVWRAAAAVAAAASRTCCPAAAPRCCSRTRSATWRRPTAQVRACIALTCCSCRKRTFCVLFWCFRTLFADPHSHACGWYEAIPGTEGALL